MARQDRAWLSGALSAVLLAGVVVASVPAAAQERDRDERDRAPARGEQRDRERHDERRRPERFAHERREARPAYGYGVPTYVPDPPPVVYAPPAPTGGLSFFFNFR